MILTIIVGIIVAAVMVHTVDLKKLSDEQDDRIIKLKAEAEATKQQLQQVQLEADTKAESDQTAIKNLESEKKGLTSKIDALNSQTRTRQYLNIMTPSLICRK